MDRCLKDKAHFIIAQTIWNNKNGKAVFAEQVFDRCQKKFQDEINRELYKLIEEGGGGGTGKDGKTLVLKAGEILVILLLLRMLVTFLNFKFKLMDKNILLKL